MKAAIILAFVILAIVGNFYVAGKPTPDAEDIFASLGRRVKQGFDSVTGDKSLSDRGREFADDVNKNTRKALEVLKGDRDVNVKIGPEGVNISAGPTREEYIMYGAISLGAFLVLICCCCCCLKGCFSN